MKSHEQFKLLSILALIALGIGFSIYKGSFVPLILAGSVAILMWLDVV